jgi:predicted MFS family arabinose efflux permease
LLIASVGTAWVFFVNAVSFFGVVGALLAMRSADLSRPHRHHERPKVREGIEYAWGVTEIRATIVLVFVVGTLVYNFPTYLTLLASDTFHGGAGLAGFLMALLGVGTVVGALTAAMRARPTSRTVVLAAALLGVSLIVAASLPGKIAVEIALIPVGALAVFFGSTANAHMQIWSEPHIRGRVMAIYTTLTLGTTVVGGPFVGWVCGRWSPRTGLALAGTVTMTAALAIFAVRRAHLLRPAVHPTTQPATFTLD